MIVHRPLFNHPEFTIREYPGYREYRVENWTPATSSSAHTQLWTYTLTIPLVLVLLYLAPSDNWGYLLIFACIAYVLKVKIFGILYESVIILPPHGIQLETNWGFTKRWSLFSSRRFIPSASLAGFVINEGLKGWNVLYHLVAVKSNRSGDTCIEVAFRDILPCHPILLRVFEGVHELLLSSPVVQHDIQGATLSE